MAIYHLSVRIISRSAGRSAVAAAAYHANNDLHEDRTGKTHRYSRRVEAVLARILAPEGATEWVFDRERLWNRVEQAERRADAQLARVFGLALPLELGPEQHVDLVLQWALEQLVGLGMVADVTIRQPSSLGDQRNHYAHIMTTTRLLTPDAFAKTKLREWNSKTRLFGWRKSWAVHLNSALERHGSDARVDCRSLAEQRDEAWDMGDIQRAADLEGRQPGRHLGRAATALRRRGVTLTREDLAPASSLCNPGDPATTAHSGAPGSPFSTPPADAQS